MENIDFNSILHQPTRTKIIAYLIAFGETDYTTIKKKFGMSDGQMTSHMKVFLESEYIGMQKFFENNRPRTTYKATKKGKAHFNEYLDEIKKLVSQIN